MATTIQTDLLLPRDPTSTLMASTKQYVDGRTPYASLIGAQCVAPYLLEDAYGTGSLTSGNFYATAFVADKSITVSNFMVNLVTAMAGGTLFRLSLYTVAANDAWTLVARSGGTITDATTAGVTTIAFNTTGGYAATYALVAGTKYATGVCQVGGTTIPVIRNKSVGAAPPLSTPAYAFKRVGFVGGAGDCPTSVAFNQPWGTTMPWIALT